jgi:hypothetical protein
VATFTLPANASTGQRAVTVTSGGTTGAFFFAPQGQPQEQRVDAILFVVPTPEIQNTLWGQLMDLRQNVMIIRLQDLIVQGLEAAVELHYLTLTLGEALKRISEQRKM